MSCETGQRRHVSAHGRPNSELVAGRTRAKENHLDSISEDRAAAAGAGEAEAAAVEAYNGSTYALVVEQSKALAPGRRFELQCGSNVVIGRSQHLAGIVVKDEMVRRRGYRANRGRSMDGTGKQKRESCERGCFG